MFHRNQLRNRDTVVRKVTRLVGEFDFAPLREVIEGVMSAAGERG